MYRKKAANRVIVALAVWLMDMLCLYLAGRFPSNDYVNWGVVSLPAVIVIFITYSQNHDLKELGFYPKYLKLDGIVMICMFIIELMIGIYIYRMPWDNAVCSWLYYICWITFREEIVYRGFIQSHLFSSHISRRASFLIGSVLFSLSHIPYQMQIRQWDGLFTIQLTITFVTHLAYCWIVDKRDNICIPWAIHVAQDFLQVL